MKYVLILGAKSDIAKALSREYAKHGYNLYLAARNAKELEPFSNDIKVRYGKEARLVDFDALDYESHQAFYDALDPRPLGVISAIVVVKKKPKATFKKPRRSLIPITQGV